MANIRHKCFISYHQEDREEVENFIAKFDDTHDSFIMRGIRSDEDVIDSDDSDYIMRQIRTKYLKDSTVTIVLLGQCTWARKFVDWELQASLRQPADGYANGLLGFILDKNATKATLPNRFKLNHDSGYAGFYNYPSGAYQLGNLIDEAYNRRSSSANLIKNPRERFSYNRSCS